MSDDDVFYRISMIMNVDPAEIAKIVHDYIERDIGCGTVYDRMNCPKPPIYIGPVKVKSLKERLEEATMHEDCYFCIKRDICTRDVPKPCKYRYTEEERIADQASDRFGAILHNTYLHPTFRKKKEDNEMKATSVQVINNVKDMNLTIEKSAFGDTRIIMSVSTDDDTYEFNCSGPGCEKFLRGTDFVPSMYANTQIKKRDETIRNLKEEIKKLKQQLQQAEHDKKRLTWKNEQFKQENENLKKELALEKAANEAQRKFFREYAGKGTEIEFNYAIGDDDETTYVIVDKEEYKALKNIQNNVRLHGMDFTPDELVDRIKELEKLKTPTIENFANEEPSSRSDILDLAKKCVCGHREQDYGTPESNFQLIADLWNDYLGFTDPGDKIQAKDVAMLMALMKIARIRNGGGSGDSFVDLAGYAACGGEIWHSNKETNGDSSQETDTV